MKRIARRGERGAAMFLAVMLLVLMGALGLAALDSASEDRRIAGMQNRSASALQAADAGVAHAVSLVAGGGANPTLPIRNLSDATVYDREVALPSYRPDPAMAATNPTGIDLNAGRGPLPGAAPNAGGGFTTRYTLINVEGRSPNTAGGGLDARMATARLEVKWGTPGSSGSDYRGQ